MCMDVTVSMDVMKTVLLLQNRLLNMVLLVCGRMYFGVLVNMDVMWRRRPGPAGLAVPAASLAALCSGAASFVCNGT